MCWAAPRPDTRVCKQHRGQGVQRRPGLTAYGGSSSTAVNCSRSGRQVRPPVRLALWDELCPYCSAPPGLSDTGLNVFRPPPDQQTDCEEQRLPPFHSRITHKHKRPRTCLAHGSSARSWVTPAGPQGRLPSRRASNERGGEGVHCADLHTIASTELAWGSRLGVAFRGVIDLVPTD